MTEGGTGGCGGGTAAETCEVYMSMQWAAGGERWLTNDNEAEARQAALALATHLPVACKRLDRMPTAPSSCPDGMPAQRLPGTVCEQI